MNINLNDLSNICYNDWKSRQFVKRQEDSYKEHVANNQNASLVDELIKKYLSNESSI